VCTKEGGTVLVRKFGLDREGGIVVGQVLLIESLVTRAGEKERCGWKTHLKESLLRTDDDEREKR